MTHRNVVAGVDGSLIAVRALDLAADEAVRRAAGLHIVYAVPDCDEAPPVLASAAARVRARHPRLPVVTSAVENGAVEALVHESEGAALTVVGTRGLGGVTGRLAGAVSLRLAARTRVPLLVVRDDRPCDRGSPRCAGRSGNSEAVRRYCWAWRARPTRTLPPSPFQEAERRRVPLRVLHAAARRHTVPRSDVARLRERHPEIPVDACAVPASPARALVEATRDAAVVVIGVHRRPSPLGSAPRAPSRTSPAAPVPLPGTAGADHQLTGPQRPSLRGTFGPTRWAGQPPAERVRQRDIEGATRDVRSPAHHPLERE